MRRKVSSGGPTGSVTRRRGRGTDAEPSGPAELVGPLLGAIARRRRDAQHEAVSVRDEEAPAAAAVALVRRLDSYLRNNTPPTTDRLASRVWGCARRAPARSVLRQLAQRRDGAWRRKELICALSCMFKSRGRTPAGTARACPLERLDDHAPPVRVVRGRVPYARADLDDQRQ